MAQRLAAVASTVPGSPLLDIAIPVYNEARDLDRNVRRLRRYLDEHFPFEARITIVDNASTDSTWDIARRLAQELSGVRFRRLWAKGRGRAVRQAWLESDAPIVAYMDVDLSTGLEALLPLVAPLVSGHSDLAIGSRIGPGARVVRGMQRELISRAYNLLLHAALGTRIRDAQCGFKALRADAARALLPAVKDEAWFFDTELIVVAQRRLMRIHEVPVDWVDDPDSRVDLVPTAIEDLRGVWRLSSQLRSFVGIGALSTLAYMACFGALRAALPAPIASAVSMLLTAFGNTAANRRFTFGAAHNGAAVRDHVSGLAALSAGLTLTTAAIWGLHVLSPNAGRLTELTVLGAANLVATGARFVMLRRSIRLGRPAQPRERLHISRRTA